MKTNFIEFLKKKVERTKIKLIIFDGIYEKSYVYLYS